MKFIVEVTDHRFRICRIVADPPASGEYELDTMADSSSMSTYVKCMEDMIELGTGRPVPRPVFVCLPQTDAEKQAVSDKVEELINAGYLGPAIKLDQLLNKFYVVPK